METIKTLFTSSGIITHNWLNKVERKKQLKLNSGNCTSLAQVHDGDVINLEGSNYQVKKIPNRERLMVKPMMELPETIQGLQLVHCGYHKCLTMYYRKVFKRLGRLPFYKGKFRHFYHRSDVFYRNCQNYNISSISGHVVDTSLFEDIRISRFVRDPRDLLISGYFYHKRSAEDWCDVVNPVDDDWLIVQGVVPEGIPADKSFAQYLNSVSMEEGLLAEIEFRKKHFQSILDWQDDNHQIKTFRYENIMNQEKQAFEKLFNFFELPYIARKYGAQLADRYSAAKKSGKKGHIRNASTGQWKQFFTPKVTARFNAEYKPVLEKLNYPV